MAPSPSWNNSGLLGGNSGPMDNQVGDGIEDERRSDLLKLILYDLNSAIAPAEHRMNALQTALTELDHDQDWKHDEELDLHADKILFQKLAFAHTANPSSEEVALLCSALEMVYRASRQRIALSFSELREAVLPLFVQMLGKPMRYQKLEELEEAKKEREEEALLSARQAAEEEEEEALLRRRQAAEATRMEHSSMRSATMRSDVSSRGPSVSADSYYPVKGGSARVESYGSSNPSLSMEGAAARVAASHHDSSFSTFGDSLRKPVPPTNVRSVGNGSSGRSGDGHHGVDPPADIPPSADMHWHSNSFAHSSQNSSFRRNGMKSFPGVQHQDPDDGSLDYSKDGGFSGDGLSYTGPPDFHNSRGTVASGGSSAASSRPGRSTATGGGSHAGGASSVLGGSAAGFGSVPGGTADPNAEQSYFARDWQQDHQQHPQAHPSTHQQRLPFYDASNASGMTRNGGSISGSKSGALVQSHLGSTANGQNDSIHMASYREDQDSGVPKDESIAYETEANHRSYASSSSPQDYSTIQTNDHAVEESKAMDPTSIGGGEFTSSAFTMSQATSSSSSRRAYDPPEVETVTSDDDDEESYDYSVKNPQGYHSPGADDISKISGMTQSVYQQTEQQKSQQLPPTHPSLRSSSASMNQSGNYSDPQFQHSALGQELETIGEETNEGSSRSFKFSFANDPNDSFSVSKNNSGRTSFNTQRSQSQAGRNRTKTSSPSSTSSRRARYLKERMKERENKSNEKIRLLEAELEMFRFDPPTNPVAVGRALQVLRYFSRVLSAMVPLAHHPGLLDSLVYQIERQPFGKYSSHFLKFSDGEVRSEFEKEELMAARIDAIATLVNLACAEENKAMVANHNGLLDAVTCVAQNDRSEEAREYSAIVIMNLAYEDENKVMMVEHPQMLATLVRLVQDKSPFTRRYASAAMFTLACVVGNTERMASFCDGEILECLRRVLEEDPVDEARINASEALFNMARNNTEETVQRMGDHPQLLASLAKAVLTDYSADVRVYCARALEWMSADVHHPMACHRTLLSALTVSAQWTKTSCIAEAFKTQATLDENRLPMASHDGLLQAVSNLAMLDSLTDADVRKASVCALEMISREPSARIHMIHNEQVMRSLTKASFEENADGSDLYYTNEVDDSSSVTGQMIREALKNLANKL